MSKSTAHPSREQLSAYNLGQMPPDEAATIESHISECERCCDTIVSLSSDDTFVGLLKEARQLPTDQTADSIGATPSSLCQDIPVQLAQHPRYEILGLIGKGGMGDVYKARHRKMERTVALKVINRGLVRKTEAIDRFQREVKAAAQLSHRNIVTAYDADQAGDFHFMVMEYVDGVDLSQTVKDRGALPVAEACDYIRQAAIGLQHAHERGMVHRDIKPHNLMVSQDGTVKILDFGLASLAPEAALDPDSVEARSDLTAAGAIMGTPDYISPEQATDARQADIRSDIYSLGATLYYLLSGRVPFADGSVMHKLKSHAQIEPESLKTLRDDIPSELAAVVSKMMAKDPDERFQTPAEVAAALEPFATDAESAAAAAPPKHLPQHDASANSADEIRVMQGHAGNGSGSGLISGDDNHGSRAWLWLGWILIAAALVCLALTAASMTTAYRMNALIGGNASGLAQGVSGTLRYMLVGAPALLAGIMVLIGTYIRRWIVTSGQKPRAAQKRSRFLPPKAIAPLFFVIIVAGVVYYIETNNGIVRVEVVDESLAVDISGQTVTMKDGGNKPIRIRAGEKKLLVRQLDSGFEFQTDNFEVRRNGQIAFKVDLVEGEVVVSKDGKPFDQGRLSLAGHATVAGGMDRLSFDMMLEGAITQAAGLPRDQWESIARNPIGSTAGIRGEPLSMVLLNLQPELVSKTDPAVLKDFRWTKGVPRPSDLQRKMSHVVLGKVSMLRGSISGLTYEKIKDDEIPERVAGSVCFEAPGLYAGEVEFVAELGKNNEPNVIEFTLPNYGLSVVRLADGTWKSKDLQSGVNAYKRPFDYDLSLVPEGAMTVYGYRPRQIRQDERFDKVLETLGSNGPNTFLMDGNLEQVLTFQWANEDHTYSQPIFVLTVIDGTAKNFARQKLGIEISDSPSDATQWEYYSVEIGDYLPMPEKQFVRFFDDKTLVLSSREFLDAHQVALQTRSNDDLRAIAASLPDGVLWVISNTSDKEFVDWIKFEVSRSPLATTLMTQIPMWEDTSHLAISLTLDDFPTLQLSAHALSADRQKQISQTARAVPVTLANLLRTYSDGRGPLDADTIGALTNALNGATITEPSNTETRISVPLKDAEPHLFRTLNSYFGRLETAKSRAFNAASVINLRQIGMAIMLFEQEHGYLPSVTTKLPGAKHPVSWRVAILKYLDETLHNQYKLDEPWDSEHNKQLLEEMPDFYRHPHQEKGITSTCYVTLAGKNTATGDGKAKIKMLDDIEDGPHQTILVTEGYLDIPWTKPEDFPIVGETTLPAVHPDPEGWNVIFVDGSTHFISSETSKEVLQALITRNGGEAVEKENGVWTMERAQQNAVGRRPSTADVDQYARLFQLRILLLKQSIAILESIVDEATAEEAAASWRDLFPIQVEAEYLEGWLVECSERDDRRAEVRQKYGQQVEELRRKLFERQRECQKLPFFQKVSETQQRYSEDLLSVKSFEIPHGHAWRANGPQFVIWLPATAPPQIDLSSEEGTLEVLIVEEETGSLHPQREHIPCGGKAVLPWPNNEQGTLYWLRPIQGPADDKHVQTENRD
jgi:serine/threonine protein kinase